MERTQKESAAETPGHVAALDGVRGVAIVAVLLFHANGGGQSSHALVRRVHEALELGWAGVTLFFVLSGFLITNILWRLRGTAKWWRTFYVRRALRIAPLYYMVLFVVLAYALVTRTLHWAAPALGVYALYLQDFPLETNAHEPFALKHLWSLAVEEQFYLVWPWLLMVMPSLRAARSSCALIVIGSLLWRQWAFAEAPQWLASTPAHAGELAVGAWLALTLLDSAEAMPLLTRLAPAWLIIGLAVALGCGLRAGSLENTHAGMLLLGTVSLSIASAALIVLAMAQGRVASALSWRPLQHLGVISYGLYVFHLLFWHEYGLLAAWILPHSAVETQLLLKSALMLGLSVGLAEASYRFFERPILRLKDKLAPVDGRLEKV